MKRDLRGYVIQIFMNSFKGIAALFRDFQSLFDSFCKGLSITLWTVSQRGNELYKMDELNTEFIHSFHIIHMELFLRTIRVSFIIKE